MGSREKYMGPREEKNGWKSVPQFGGWENNSPAEPTSYTMVFSQARVKRKQNKTDLTEFKRNSLGNEQELMAATNAQNQDDSVRKKTFLTYINCCIRP